MPKKIIDYSKTIIYKLVCNDLNTTDVYVGHTTNYVKRKASHKERCNNEKSKKYNLKVYKVMRENGGWDNWSMIEIEKYPCNDMNEATKQERYWYEQLNANMNQLNPNRNQAEYLEVKKEYFKIKNKEYRELHKDEIREGRKLYRDSNKDKIKEHRHEYYEENKDKVLNKLKVYRENNKEKLKERKSEKHSCECGKNYTINHKKRHERTKFHQDYINNQNNINEI